jgi:hypothetical protein
MDLLRNLFGNVTSGIIRLAVAAGVLFLCYLFIVKPILDTTNEVFEKSGFNDLGKTLEGVSKDIKREVNHSIQATKRNGGNPKKLIHCVEHANGNVVRINRCTRRHGGD